MHYYNALQHCDPTMQLNNQQCHPTMHYKVRTDRDTTAPKLIVACHHLLGMYRVSCAPSTHTNTVSGVEVPPEASPDDFLYPLPHQKLSLLHGPNQSLTQLCAHNPGRSFLDVQLAQVSPYDS